MKIVIWMVLGGKHLPNLLSWKNTTSIFTVSWESYSFSIVHRIFAYTTLTLTCFFYPEQKYCNLLLDTSENIVTPLYVAYSTDFFYYIWKNVLPWLIVRHLFQPGEILIPSYVATPNKKYDTVRLYYCPLTNGELYLLHLSAPFLGRGKY
jgi:hypothetical protein